MAYECPFCPMFEGTNASVIDIEPLNPVTYGHRIVIPREHIKDFTEKPEVTAEVMDYAAKRAKELAIQKSYPAMNLITSAGKAATQSVFHLHVHLVPRFPGDDLKLPWTDQINRSSKD